MSMVTNRAFVAIKYNFVSNKIFDVSKCLFHKKLNTSRMLIKGKTFICKLKY